MKPKILEKHVRAVIKDYLNMRHLDWYYNLQGLGAYKGIPDLAVIFKGTTIYIEVKKPGGKQSPAQIEFEMKCKKNKAIYLLADDADIVKNFFEPYFKL